MSPLPGCLFLKNTLSPILKLDGVQVVCACLNLFSSKDFLAMANARWCDSGVNGQNQDHQGITIPVPVIDGEVNMDLFHKLGRKVFQGLQGVLSHGSWLILG